MASQPCPAVREPALDRGAVYAVLPGGRAVYHSMEIRRRAGPVPPGGDGGRAHGGGLLCQPAVRPRRAVQLGQRHRGGVHPAVCGRAAPGVEDVPGPPAGGGPAGGDQQRPQPPHADRGRGGGRRLGHQRLQVQQDLRPSGGGGGRRARKTEPDHPRGAGQGHPGGHPRAVHPLQHLWHHHCHPHPAGQPAEPRHRPVHVHPLQGADPERPPVGGDGRRAGPRLPRAEHRGLPLAGRGDPGHREDQRLPERQGGAGDGGRRQHRQRAVPPGDAVLPGPAVDL